MRKHSKLSAAILLGSGIVASGSSAGVLLEEIVVTAQKREESVQSVPISISALSGDAMSEIGIQSTDDLALAVPGLQMQQNGIGNVPFIRGIGAQDSTAGQDGSVSTYIDGVLVASVFGSSMGFNNVERVEVLKGPQGTLFGRNTTGGVINIVTKDPTQEPELKVGASVGNYETSSVDFYGSTGLTENLAANISFRYGDQGEGYSDNLLTGRDVNKREDDINLHTKFKYIGDTFEATLAYKHYEMSDDMGYVRSIPPGFTNIVGTTVQDDRWDLYTDTDGEADFESDLLSLTLIKSFDSFDVKSITAWNDNENYGWTDNDFSALYFNNAEIIFLEENISQELQFISTTDGPLTWIAGLYYFEQEARGEYSITGLALAGDGLSTLQLNGEIDTTSYAGFGEVAYHFSDVTKLTVGLRWTKDERDFSSRGLIGSIGGVADPNKGHFPEGDPVLVLAALPSHSESWDEPTYRLVLDHQFNDDILGYVSYNRGFRSGNYITAVSADQEPFNPEFVDAYEIGLKSDLLDGTLRVNTAVYFYDIEDLQFQVLEGVSTKTLNAAGAEITGFELDVVWQVTDELALSYATSYIDGEYSDFDSATSYDYDNLIPGFGGGNSGAVIPKDVSGFDLASTPEFTHSVGVSYVTEKDSGQYSANLRATYTDEFAWEPDAVLFQDSYTMVNASVGWRSPDDVWGVRLSGANLLDEFYAVTARQTVATGAFEAPGKPRTFDVSVNYRFF
jgi:iron complex outermembrane recepter protein